MFFSSPIYCMDASSELLASISRVERKIAYFNDQMIALDFQFKRILSLKDKIPIEEYTKQHDEAITGLRETRTNLNSENRMLSILKNKLDNNDFTFKQTSSAQKRPFSDN